VFNRAAGGREHPPKRGWLTIATALGLLVAACAGIGLPALAAVTSELGLDEALRDRDTLRLDGPLPEAAALASVPQQILQPIQARLAPYVSPVGTAAQTGPVLPATVNDLAVRVDVAGLRPTVAYRPDLPSHVRMIGGRLPADQGTGLDLRGLDAVAASMSQDAADTLGVKLSDRFCVHPGDSGVQTPAMMCFRLIGVWRVRDPGSLYWWDGSEAVQLMVGRSDFAGLLAEPGINAGARLVTLLRLERSQLSRGRVSDLRNRLAAVRSSLRERPEIVLTTSMDQALDAYAAGPGLPAQFLTMLANTIAVLAALAMIVMFAIWILASDAGSMGWLLRDGRTGRILRSLLRPAVLVLDQPGRAVAARLAGRRLLARPIANVAVLAIAALAASAASLALLMGVQAHGPGLSRLAVAITAAALVIAVAVMSVHWLAERHSRAALARSLAVNLPGKLYGGRIGLQLAALAIEALLIGLLVGGLIAVVVAVGLRLPAVVPVVAVIAAAVVFLALAAALLIAAAISVVLPERKGRRLAG
jgi:hypothetical protein